MNYQYQYHYNSGPFNYVKKEDAKQLLGKSRYTGVIFAITLIILFGAFELFIFPKLKELQLTYQVNYPFYSLPNFRYSFYIVILALLTFIQPEPPVALEQKLTKYKTGEMILVSSLIDKSYNAKIGLIFFVAIAYFIFAVIMPIYDITGSI